MDSWPEPAADLPEPRRNYRRKNEARPRKAARYPLGSSHLSGDPATDFLRRMWFGDQIERDQRKRAKSPEPALSAPGAPGGEDPKPT